MTTLFRIIPALALALSVAACDKSDSGEKKGDDKKAAGDKKGGDAKGGDAKGGDAKAAAGPAKKAWLKIDQYGIQIEAPEGAKAEPGAGTSLMIMSPDGSCTIMLSKKDDMTMMQNYDQTLADIEKGTMGKKKEILKNEKKDDTNWSIHYTKEAMTDPNKTQHGVAVHRKIGDHEYSCGRIQDSEDDAKCVLAACESMKI